jgi:hypothetical protein
VEHKVIVFFWPERCWLRSQFPGHAEMNANPVAAGKFEKHLFSPGERMQKTSAR